jgi:hypothetical protein
LWNVSRRENGGGAPAVTGGGELDVAAGRRNHGGVGRLASVVVLVALVVAVAASVGSAAPTRTSKLTKVENRWAVPTVNLMKSLSGRVGGIGKQISDPAILTKGSKAQLKLAVTLANIISCGQKLKKNGAPPTARLKPYYAAVRSACSYYTQGAHQLAKGIGKGDAKLIASSGTTIKRGSALLALAQTRLLQLAS